MPRKRHVSRNVFGGCTVYTHKVMPRKRHVSRNDAPAKDTPAPISHASQEACE